MKFIFISFLEILRAWILTCIGCMSMGSLDGIPFRGSLICELMRLDIFGDDELY